MHCVCYWRVPYGDTRRFSYVLVSNLERCTLGALCTGIARRYLALSTLCASKQLPGHSHNISKWTLKVQCSSDKSNIIWIAKGRIPGVEC